MSPDLHRRRLIVLRHAKSDWSGDETDVDRPLAPRGRRQAPEAGQWLNSNVDAIDLALVSSAQRTRSTWDLVAAELDSPPPSRIEDRLYAATARALLEVVRSLPDDLSSVVLVGHNPGVEDLVRRLTGADVEMTTSAIAVIAMAGSWVEADDETGTLITSGRPPS